MAINRKTFLKTFGGVGLGLMAGQLSASSFGQQSSGAFELAQNEEKHLKHFYAQLGASAYISANDVRAFQPARLVKRKRGIRGYHFEYIAQNGSRIVMTRKKGQLVTKTFNA